LQGNPGIYSLTPVAGGGGEAPTRFQRLFRAKIGNDKLKYSPTALIGFQPTFENCTLASRMNCEKL
jgi:hypothetical protein